MISSEEMEALRVVGEFLKRHQITHVLLEKEWTSFNVRSFEHGWRNAKGATLDEAFWKHLEQVAISQGGLPMGATLIPRHFQRVEGPTVIASGLPSGDTPVSEGCVCNGNGWLDDGADGNCSRCACNPLPP